MIGQTVSHYRITSQLGVGGMGEVFLAEDTQLHCQRALKFLPTAVTKDSPEHTRLVNEARALAVLEHPNICPVQEIGEHEGQTFIVMSYLEGRTLKDRIAEGPVPLGEALEIARQVSAGLAAAHAKGIVHRDIKPDNIMLVEGNNDTGGQLRAVLMDFGIAKNREATLATRTGTIMGTVAYMSPEQAQGIKVDTSTDTWAVGVILYEMLSGERPFPGDSEPALLYAIVNVEPEPLAGGESKIPESVDRVVGKALAKDPKNRYADASELLEDIERATEGEDVKGRRLGKGNRGRIIGAIAGAVSLICVALFVWPGFLVPSDAISRLAVMPLEDRSGDPDRAFFAEGVADEMQKGLSKIGALTIVSLNSASQAKELYESNREIGDHLGVEALVEGSVQVEGERVKVSVQLVAIEDDRVLWSESYTRDMKDILNLQSEIALAVSAALETHLTPGEQENLARDRQIDPEAWEAILLGWRFIDQATNEEIEKGIKLFERALAIQPDLAIAHAGLADAYNLKGQMDGLPPSAVEPMVRYHSRRTMELDPDSADANAVAAGVAKNYDYDLATAGEFFVRARELDPNMNMIDYAQYLNVMGRHQDALVQAQHAVRVDPLSDFTQANLAFRYLYLGQTDAAFDVVNRLQEWAPDNWVGMWALGLTHLHAGNPGGAIVPLRTADINSGHDDVKPQLVHALLLDGQREEAEAILEEMEARSAIDYVSPVLLGLTYAAFGRADEAFAGFELSIAERDFWMLWIADPVFCPFTSELESDPRWPDLLRRMGIPAD